MSVWLVVPVRSLRDGKSRLAPALDPVQRTALIEWLLVRTLKQAAQFPGLKRTLVVSPCEEARACASAFGTRVLDERAPGGLNQALRQAQLALSDLDATRMLMVACDLPLVRTEDLHQLASASSVGTVALAPDRSRQGTNGICLETRVAFDFSFGPNSFERHLHCVQQLGMSSRIVDTPALAFDVDTPGDLGGLRAFENEMPQFGDIPELHRPIEPNGARSKTGARRELGEFPAGREAFPCRDAAKENER